MMKHNILSTNYFLLIILVIIVLLISGCESSSVDSGSSDGDTSKGSEPEKIPDGYGCCSPACKIGAQDVCNMAGGSWTPGSCQAVDECKIGCCVPACGSSTKVYCDQAGGEWRGASCDQQPECKVVCCDFPDSGGTESVDMKREECIQSGGVPKEQMCTPQVEGDIVYEIKHSPRNCDCSDANSEKGYLSYNCQKTDDVIERLTFVADKDSVSNDGGPWSNGGSTIGGTATYSLTGNSKHSISKESKVTCDTNPVTYSTSSTNQEELETFNEFKQSNRASLSVYKEEGIYYFELSLGEEVSPKAQRKFTRSTINNCPNAKASSPEEEQSSEPYEGGTTGVSFSGELSGSQDVVGYQEYGFFCDDDKRAEAKVTWNLNEVGID